jgi:DNA polymerase-1
MSQKRLVIIDGNAIIHRAYHAIPPLTTKDGQIVNAVYGFTSMLLKVMSVIKPTHITASFDLAGPTFRHEKFSDYKATRVKADQELYDQIPLVKEVVRTFDIPIYEKSGFEADDVIGTITQKNKKNDDLEIYIVTGDKDTFQLIDKNVKVFTLRQGITDTVLYDEKLFREKFGFAPEQMIDYKALRGDPSDNIPGVKGIGDKTATTLIQEFKTITDLYQAVEETNQGKKSEILKGALLDKLTVGKDSAEMSYELATIDQHVPEINFSLSDCQIRPLDREKIIKLFQKLEFNSLLKRVPGFENLIEAKKEKKKNIKKDDFKFLEIKTEKEVKELLIKIKNKKVFSSQAVFTGDDLFLGKFSGVVVVVENEGYFLNDKFDYPWFAESGIELVGHDLKKLIKILKIHKNIEVKNDLFDLMLASYILNPSSRAHDMASIALKIIGQEIKEESGQSSLFGVDARQVANDIFLIYLTRDKLEKELVKVNNFDLFKKIEIPLLKVLAKTELNGIAIDKKELKKLSEKLAEKVGKITKEIYKMAGEEFNISSSQQLREILFDKLNIPTVGIKKGKTGLSTAAAELEKMRGLHPIIDLIENYREITKLQNTYVDVLPDLVNEKTHRLHTTFNQAVTATGRLSSSDPNLQNIPIRTELGREIRKVFVAEHGNVMLSADYSQIELRIVASLAEDERMIEIFKQDKDIHQATAAIINGVAMDKVTKEMRRAAKEVNFGVLYGMGSFGLSARTGLSQFEAQDFIKRYFDKFSGVKKYLDTTLKLAKQTGYVETLFGRRRYVPELNTGHFQLRAAAERMAINQPIQGTAADLIKMAMIAVAEKIESYGDKVRMILQVHDELVFEVEEKLADEISALVKQEMENVIKLRVPIKVEIHQGKNWGK